MIGTYFWRSWDVEMSVSSQRRIRLSACSSVRLPQKRQLSVGQRVCGGGGRRRRRRRILSVNPGASEDANTKEQQDTKNDLLHAVSFLLTFRAAIA